MSKIVENELRTVIQLDKHRDRHGVYRWNYPEEIFPPDFSKYLFEKKKSSGNEAATYNPTKALDILRAMRNIYIHRTKLPEDIKNYIGNFGREEYLKFWHNRFPKFLQVLYRAMRNVLDDQNAKELWKFYPEMVDKMCAEQQREESSQSSKSRMMRCANTSCAVKGMGRFCQECGSKMVDICSLDTVVICNGKLEDDSPCHAKLVPGKKFCKNCGEKVDPNLFQSTKLTCSKCQTVLEPGSIFCSECDHKQQKPSDVQAAREMRVETASPSQSGPEMPEQQMSSITHHSSLSLPSADIVKSSNSVQSKQAARLTNAVSDERDGINAEGVSQQHQMENSNGDITTGRPNEINGVKQNASQEPSIETDNGGSENGNNILDRKRNIASGNIRYKTGTRETENVMANERGDNSEDPMVRAETGDIRGSSQQNPALVCGQQSISQDSDLTADALGSFSFSSNDGGRNSIPRSLTVKQGSPVEDPTGQVSDAATENQTSDCLSISPTLQSNDDTAEQKKLMSSRENGGEIKSAYSEKKKTSFGFSRRAYLVLGIGVLFSIVVYKKFNS